MLTILCFWLPTALSERFADVSGTTKFKALIPWEFLIPIPALMAAGGSDFRPGSKMRGPVVQAKKRRIPIIATNGFVILAPSTIYLSAKALAGAFYTEYCPVQGLALTAGAVNIPLLGLNMHDGLRLAGKCKHEPQPG